MGSLSIGWQVTSFPADTLNSEVKIRRRIETVWINMKVDGTNFVDIRSKLWMYIMVSTHYRDVLMGAMASQITSLTMVYWTVYSGADQRKHQSSASLAFMRGLQRGPVNSPRKWPVTRKIFKFDDVIMKVTYFLCLHHICETQTCYCREPSLLRPTTIYSRSRSLDTRCNFKSAWHSCTEWPYE